MKFQWTVPPSTRDTYFLREHDGNGSIRAVVTVEGGRYVASDQNGHALSVHPTLEAAQAAAEAAARLDTSNDW